MQIEKLGETEQGTNRVRSKEIQKYLASKLRNLASDEQSLKSELSRSLLLASRVPAVDEKALLDPFNLEKRNLETDRFFKENKFEKGIVIGECVGTKGGVEPIPRPVVLGTFNAHWAIL